MSLPVFNVTSESDCSSSDNGYNDNLNNSRLNASQVDSSHNQRSDLQNMQAAHLYSIQFDAVKDPLFKIIFRDELTSRKYRQRLEDIIKFVLLNETDESNQNQSSLVLDIFDPKSDIVSTSHTQPTQSFIQATQQVPLNSSNYINQNAHIDSSNIKKKLRHKQKLKQSEESTSQSDFSHSTTVLTPQAAPQTVPQIVQETQIDISHIKQEKPDNPVPSNSIKKSSDKSELLNSEKLDVQTKITSTTLPAHSFIQQVPELTIQNVIQVKQESSHKINSTNSEKTLKDNYNLQETDEPSKQVLPITQVPATSPTAKQNVASISMHLKQDLKTNSSSKLVLEKIESSEQFPPNCPSQLQCLNTFTHNHEINIKSELVGNGSNITNKNLKHKLETQEMDDSHVIKKPKTNSYDETDNNLRREIYEIILDDSNYSLIEKNLETSFENNTIKIGSYGYFSSDKSVFLSKDGLTFAMSNINGKKPKILSIELDDILKVLVHFSKVKPALFFFVTTKVAVQIRTMLNMYDPSGPYFDPNSLDLKHQRIAILPAQMNDESESIIRKLFKNKEMVEIDAQVADDLANLAITTNNITHKKCSKEINDATESKAPDYVKTNHGTSYFCRIIRVGSLEYAKKRAILLCNNSVKFCVPHLDNASLVTISLDLSDFTKVDIYFSKNIPMMFFYLTKKAANKIKSKIGMTDHTGYYLDPSGCESYNKIILLPQTLSEGCHVLKEWFAKNKITKLNKETAKNILSRSLKNNIEKINIRPKGSAELKGIDTCMTNTGAPPEKNVDKIFNADNNATRERFSENTENRVRYTFNTAKGNPDKEYNKTDPVPEFEETTEVVSNTCIRIKAECVKVGSYKYNESLTSVIISSEGLNFDLPKIDDNTKHKMYIVIKMHEITELWYFFSISSCFIFFTTTSACAQNIRLILGMHERANKKPKYFDPVSESLSERRLAIVFNQTNFKYRSIFKTILMNLKVNTIKDYKTARKMMRNKL